ncbi:cupin domain-containing protein [Bradyrhizobium manausense]|uniref:cupin domain-containing protein n=1 Tax=Bradyrhizobium TaxID=374 RepID=UPI001BA7A3C2|nr:MULTISPECIES: cupin domain-containing protein [Bradyrhizobium]MBR0831140.1 cupin domain-containing protein [Bradyrhizobium manausense]UVO29173.1 cupin domain-containing protein [Bradyrhizobium arachidis]
MNDMSTLDDLKSAHLTALWEHAGTALSHEPRPTEPPFYWSWNSLKRFGEIAADQVSTELAERRVLVLANPAFGGKLATTGTLNAAIQILNPGETAEPHRHSMAAIRLITNHDGGFTTVNGLKCPMHAGDLLLTPPWCWHGHKNDTDRRIMWIDVLDVPLVIGWNGVFFEHPAEDSPRVEQAIAFPDAAWSGSGIVQSILAADTSFSPRLRYPWSEAKIALDAAQGDEDGRTEVHYVNPLNGDPVMPTIDCHAVRLSPNMATRARRSTASTVCFVVSGQGQSTVGQERFSWSENDVFTIPNWQWASHQAQGGPAYIVEVSNRGMLAKLGLLRAEVKSQA